MPTAVMTEPTAPPLPAPAPRLIGLRILLILAALWEAFEAYSSVSILFGDMSEIPGPGFGGFLIKAQLASHLPLALAALLFAVIGRVRYAIMALAAVVVMTWLNYMPSVVRPHGFEFNGFYGTIETTAQIIAFPLMAACAVALAARNRRLGIATALVTLPTLFNFSGIALFAISVALYGF
jgi:hypothetical protein